MKLYEVPRHSWVRVVDKEVKIPPAAPNVHAGDAIFFDHIDGMYSFCRDTCGNVVHLAAWTEVEPVDYRDDRDA